MVGVYRGSILGLGLVFRIRVRIRIRVRVLWGSMIVPRPALLINAQWSRDKYLAWPTV